jgi:hypothetical protein
LILFCLHSCYWDGIVVVVGNCNWTCAACRCA